MIHKCLLNVFDYDYEIQFNNRIHSHNTRNKNNLHLPHVKTNWEKHRTAYHAANDWNSLPTDMKESKSVVLFKPKLSKLFINCKIYLNSFYNNFSV